MLSPVLIEGPASAPVSLEDAKAHCRVDHSDDDGLIAALIDAATAHLDGYTGILGRALVTQTWRQDFSRFGSCLRLPIAPVSQVSAVTYQDVDGVSRTADPAIYDLLADARGPYLALRSGASWPPTYRRPDAVSVTYIAGAEPDAVPTPIKQAILLTIGHWYENREAVSAGDAREVPLAVTALTAPYRRVGV